MANKSIEVFIDADACPVKDEVYKVASRYRLKTYVVANAFLMVPTSPLIERVIVDAGADVADERWPLDGGAGGREPGERLGILKPGRVARIDLLSQSGRKPT